MPIDERMRKIADDAVSELHRELCTCVDALYVRVAELERVVSEISSPERLPQVPRVRNARKTD